jgi:hypothetical protein
MFGLSLRAMLRVGALGSWSSFFVCGCGCYDDRTEFDEQAAIMVCA